MIRITHKGVNILPALLFLAGQARKLLRRKNMEPVDIDKLAAETIEDVKGLKTLAPLAKDIKTQIAAESNLLKKIWAGGVALHRLIAAVIKRVEEIGANLKLAGKQKKELAVAVINKLVNLPVLNESMEAMVIGFAVDAMVTGFNEHFTKDWYKKIPIAAD